MSSYLKYSFHPSYSVIFPLYEIHWNLRLACLLIYFSWSLCPFQHEHNLLGSSVKICYFIVQCNLLSQEHCLAYEVSSLRVCWINDEVSNKWIKQMPQTGMTSKIYGLEVLAVHISYLHNNIKIIHSLRQPFVLNGVRYVKSPHCA